MIGFYLVFNLCYRVAKHTDKNPLIFEAYLQKARILFVNYHFDLYEDGSRVKLFFCFRQGICWCNHSRNSLQYNQVLKHNISSKTKYFKSMWLNLILLYIIFIILYFFKPRLLHFRVHIHLVHDYKKDQAHGSLIIGQQQGNRGSWLPYQWSTTR